MIGTMFALIQVSTVSSQANPLNGLFTPNNSQQFFEEGREKLEDEIKRLEMQRMPSNDDLLQIKKAVMSPQGVQGWCVDSEGNLILMGDSEAQVINQPDSVIPNCH